MHTYTNSHLDYAFDILNEALLTCLWQKEMEPGERERKVEQLLQMGANPHYTDKNGNNAFMVASARGNQEAFEEFEARGYDIDSTLKICREINSAYNPHFSLLTNQFPLYLSSKKDFIYSVYPSQITFNGKSIIDGFILKYKAQTEDSRKALIFNEIVKILNLKVNEELKYYDKLTLQKEMGKCIAKSIQTNHLNLLKFLLTEGAEFIEQGEKCITLAASVGSTDMLKLLYPLRGNFLDKEEQSGLAIYNAVRRKDMDILKSLIEEGYSASTPMGIALFNCANANYTEGLEFLINNGATIKPYEQDLFDVCEKAKANQAMELMVQYMGFNPKIVYPIAIQEVVKSNQEKERLEKALIQGRPNFSNNESIKTYFMDKIFKI